MAFARGRTRALLVAALAGSAALVAASAWALAGAGDGEGTTLATAPDLSLPTTPTPSATPPPTAAPTATALPSASPSPTASAAPAATVTTSPTPGPTTATYAFPRPTRQYDGLVLTATIDPGGGTESTTFRLTVRGEDGDGQVFFGGLTWGDGAGEPGQASPQRCESYPPPTSPPGAYSPSPSAATYAFSHRYAARATPYTIHVTLQSVNRTCKPNGPAPETRQVDLQVAVSET